MNPIYFQGQVDGQILKSDQTVECIFIKLNTHIAHDEGMNPIDFQGQRSKSQWKNMEIAL